jgi:hypothetical protein
LVSATQHALTSSDIKRNLGRIFACRDQDDLALYNRPSTFKGDAPCCEK